jgi:hypothetical protein
MKYFAYLCIHANGTALPQERVNLRTELTFDDRLLKPTAKMNRLSWIV